MTSPRGALGTQKSLILLLTVNHHIIMSVLRRQLAARTTAVFSSPRKTAFVYTVLPRFMSMSASAFDAKHENILISRS
jgi:hypothetical protein